jgi:hypothetical protein
MMEPLRQALNLLDEHVDKYLAKVDENMTKQWVEARCIPKSTGPDLIDSVIVRISKTRLPAWI